MSPALAGLRAHAKTNMSSLPSSPARLGTVDDRRELLERYGRCYGELGLALAFTDGLRGEAAKQHTAGWKRTVPLPHPARGIALLTSSGQSANPIVVLGASRLIGVDEDGEQGRALRHSLGVEFPPTVTVLSGREEGGRHFWYRSPEGAPAGVVKLQLSEKVTVSTDGYLVCPPARHPSGRLYSFAPGLEPWSIEIAELPPATVIRLAAEHRTASAEAITNSGPVTTNHRHNHLRRIASVMRRYSGASLEAIEAALLAENATRCEPPKDVELVRALAKYTVENWEPKA